MSIEQSRRAALPRPRQGVTRERRGLGLLLALTVPPVLTAALVTVRGDVSLASVLLLYLLAVVAVSAVGGLLGGVVAAACSFLLANFFLTPPFHTFDVARRDSVIALLVFLVVAVTVSGLVDLAARRQAAAARSDAEAALLGRAASDPLVGRSAEAVLADVATTFSLGSVVLIGRDGLTAGDVVLARVGPTSVGPPTVRVDAGPDRWLVGYGAPMFAEDRALLSTLAHAASRAVDARDLADQASRARELAEVDRLRAALLAAVGHDLRTPLAGIKAAASTLRQDGDGAVALTEADREAMLATIETGADRLTDLVGNLLDLSRLQAGALSLELQPVSLDEVVARALLEKHLGQVANLVADDLPLVLADPGLLQRVVANLAENAARHSAGGGPVEVDAHASAEAVTLTVVDHGPGVPPADWDRMFVPFQRLHDHSTDSGVGLGLAIVQGFIDAMDGTVVPSESPGGGLTMTVTLPRADVGAHA